jgi:hypothetical protein
MIEAAESSRTPSDKTEGWQPDRMNPNLQRYWDGSTWTATRRWVAGKWVDEAAVTVAVPPAAQPSAPGTRYSSSSAQGSFSTGAVAARPASRPATISAALGGLFLCSFLLILGSFTPWISVSIDGHSFASVAGTDAGVSQLIGVNGWITFSAGILLFILVCMIVVSGDAFFRTAALLVAVAAAGFAVYDLVRIIQKISQAASSASSSTLARVLHTDNSVGWGLIVVVVGGVGALVCALGTRNEP